MRRLDGVKRETLNPAIIHRYGQAHAALVPLWEWRFLKGLEEAVRSGEIDAPNFLARCSAGGWWSTSGSPQLSGE